MPDVRDAILSAVLEADRMHKQFDTKARADRGEGRINVFEMLVDRDIPVMFRPLDGLLGAFLDKPSPGVIVTTLRALPVQRFTAAHELGHFALGHETSLDEEEILARSPFVKGASYDLREIQANAFASQLLAPSWLLVKHMRRQGWTRDNLTDPVTVYQLSLRLGTSYSATCYALTRHKVINQGVCGSLLETKPKTIKQGLAAPYQPESWYGDVWLITERDDRMILEGSQSDLVVLKFMEHGGSGYVWQLGDLADAGLVIVQDGRVAADPDEQSIGGVAVRTVIAQSVNGTSGHVRLREVRPWQLTGEPLQSLDLDVDLSGPLRPGLLPAQREALLSVA
jgi:Zn-dependent peptidase ImmA (M78 family)/predicted secreted protein